MSSVATHSQYVVPGSHAAPTRDAVRHAIRNAEDLRRRIRDLTKEAIIERKVSLDDLSALTGDTIQGAAEALNDTLPASRQSALRQVVDGLADAYAGMADATRAGLDEASHRGARLSKAEAKKLRHALSTLEQSFLDATLGSAMRLSVQARQDLAAVLSQMRGHGTSITPAAKRAMNAAEKHWPDLVDETVKVGGSVAKAAATSLLLGASGLLEGMAKGLKSQRATVVMPEEPLVVTRRPGTKAKAKPKATAKGSGRGAGVAKGAAAKGVKVGAAKAGAKAKSGRKVASKAKASARR